MRISKGLLGCTVMWVLGGIVTAACGNDGADISSASNGPDGSTTQPDGATNNTADSGNGEPITDGGSNFDFDGGDEFADAGLDGSTCNDLTNDAPAVRSDCISISPALGGGALVPGKYYLVAVNDLGTNPFCQNLFVSVSFKETMNLAVNAQGTGLATTITQVGDNAARARTMTLNPGRENFSPLVLTQTCPARSPQDVAYASGHRDNKQILRLRLPYGAFGTAIYVFEKQ